MLLLVKFWLSRKRLKLVIDISFGSLAKLATAAANCGDGACQRRLISAGIASAVAPLALTAGAALQLSHWLKLAPRAMVPANNPTYINLVATNLDLAVAWLPLIFLLTTYQLTTILEI